MAFKLHGWGTGIQTHRLNVGDVCKTTSTQEWTNLLIFFVWWIFNLLCQRVTVSHTWITITS